MAQSLAGFTRGLSVAQRLLRNAESSTARSGEAAVSLSEECARSDRSVAEFRERKRALVTAVAASGNQARRETEIAHVLEGVLRASTTRTQFGEEEQVGGIRFHKSLAAANDSLQRRVENAQHVCEQLMDLSAAIEARLNSSSSCKLLVLSVAEVESFNGALRAQQAHRDRAMREALTRLSRRVLHLEESNARKINVIARFKVPSAANAASASTTNEPRPSCQGLTQEDCRSVNLSRSFKGPKRCRASRSESQARNSDREHAAMHAKQPRLVSALPSPQTPNSTEKRGSRAKESCATASSTGRKSATSSHSQAKPPGHGLSSSSSLQFGKDDRGAENKDRGVGERHLGHPPRTSDASTSGTSGKECAGHHNASPNMQLHREVQAKQRSKGVSLSRTSTPGEASSPSISYDSNDAKTRMRKHEQRKASSNEAFRTRAGLLGPGSAKTIRVAENAPKAWSRRRRHRLRQTSPLDLFDDDFALT
mmetsp:Transcript_4696/g.14897  ORF Transcript_4696/g.14897 Transcript_4696/m.14897 type:complete len:481 (+) Transcript_4696:1-1443(+)